MWHGHMVSQENKAEKGVVGGYDKIWKKGGFIVYQLYIRFTGDSHMQRLNIT